MSLLEAKQTRQHDLDFIRVISILAVIVIHGIAGVVLTKSIDTPAWLLANTVDSFARWAVPVFLMLSGALLIRPISKFEMKDFLRKRFSHILIPLIAWPAIYTVWYAYIAKSQPDWQGLLLGYLNGTNIAPHLYFLFIIAGLYLITPIINIIRGATSNRQFLAISLSILTVTTFWYTAESFLPGHSISLNALTQSIPYIGYFMLGSCLKSFKFKHTVTPIYIFIIAGIVMSIATYLTVSKYGTAGNGLFFYSYFSILTMFMAPFAFYALRSIYIVIESRLKHDALQKTQKTLLKLSNATFGVYLVHIIVLMYLSTLVPVDQASVKGASLLIVLTIVISYLLSLTLMKIPYARRLII